MQDEETHEEKYSHEGTFWENGRSIGDLEPSTQDMAQERKDVIKYALGLNIRDIRTYAGFKGDLLVEITSNDKEVIDKIKAWAENLDMKTVLKENPMIQLYEIFCITPDDVYELNLEKEETSLY